MVTQTNKAKLSITLDLAVHEKVLKLAEEDSRSLSQQINKILKDYFLSKDLPKATDSTE